MKKGKYHYIALHRAKDYHRNSEAWKMKQRRRVLLALGLFWFCVYQALSAGGVL